MLVVDHGCPSAVGHLIGHLQEQQKRDLFRVRHLPETVVPQNMGEFQALETICWETLLMIDRAQQNKLKLNDHIGRRITDSRLQYVQSK